MYKTCRISVAIVPFSQATCTFFYIFLQISIVLEAYQGKVNVDKGLCYLKRDGVVYDNRDGKLKSLSLSSCCNSYPPLQSQGPPSINERSDDR
jgi:hypothetical protein